MTWATSRRSSPNRSARRTISTSSWTLSRINTMHDGSRTLIAQQLVSNLDRELDVLDHGAEVRLHANGLVGFYLIAPSTLNQCARLAHDASYSPVSFRVSHWCWWALPRGARRRRTAGASGVKARPRRSGKALRCRRPPASPPSRQLFIHRASHLGDAKRGCPSRTSHTRVATTCSRS